uniref:Connectin n=1 Tax=Trichogramma kaykai TaxID=54128 RepID=A0ABD2WXZ5_9HYME
MSRRPRAPPPLRASKQTKSKRRTSTVTAMRILLLGILLLCCSFSLTESAITKQRSRKKPSKDQQHRDLNVCDFEQTDSPLFCYCNDNKLDSAEDANCLIFKKLELSDPIWAHFNSQLYIHKLSFIVRSEGEISYIPTAVLRQLKHLNTVSFQHAKLEAIESQSFGTLPSLSTIILNKNNIQWLKWHAFENLRNLTLLNLDENDISELSRDIFYELPKIQKLFLNHNNVSVLHDRAFEHLPTLEELELNNNKISVVTADSFKRLRMLQRLDLRNNLIAMLGDRCFAEMPDLKELHLDQNQIKFISSKALDGLRHLKMLRLSENKLVTLEPDFLVGTPSLTLLDLRDNQISTMTFDNIKPIITNLYNNSSYFYLDGNKLICDCKLAWIWGLRNETRNSKLREGLEELTCFLEASYESRFDTGEDLNRALEIVRNTGSRHGDYHARQNSMDETYMGDNDGYEDYSAGEDYSVGAQVVVEGKPSYVKHLFDLKPELLPCPQPTHEDVMASEQPSSRHSSSIFSFATGGGAGQIEACAALTTILLAVSVRACLT